MYGTGRVKRHCEIQNHWSNLIIHAKYKGRNKSTEVITQDIEKET